MLKPFLIILLAFYAGYRIRTSVITTKVEEEYDFIIVGGGTTGAALAGRLSEDPHIKILVLEAGPSDLSEPQILVPAYEPLERTSKDWDYRTVRQEYALRALMGQADRWSAGKILGGTSSYNRFTYHRGSPHDYDSWEDQGATGWGWNEVEKYFKKVERASGKDLSKKLGRKGALNLERGHSVPILNGIIEEAAAEIGIPKTDYIDQLEGFSELVVATEDGLRRNSVEAYLRSHFPKRRKRLHVVVNARVKKVLLERGTKGGRRPKAVGVTYVKNGKTQKVAAKKEVILSAGAVETPHLLMLSGIGPKEHLEQFGIQSFVDLPGVGSNLQDHLRILQFMYSSSLPKGATLTNAEVNSLDSARKYISNSTGPLLTNFLTALLHLRTNVAETPASLSTRKRPFPEVQISIYPFTLTAEEFIGSDEASTSDSSNYRGEVRKAFTERGGVLSSFGIVPSLLHPKSRGTIRLNSSDPFEDPLINPRYLSHKDDVEVFTAGLRIVEELLQTKVFRKFDVTQVMQPFCNTSENSNFPRSDEFYECVLRTSAASQYHPCCSAKMGSKSDRNSVVDERLRVYNVDGLRIADMSVMPHAISGNTMAACYMIAEKASHMIKQDWRMHMRSY